MKQIRFGSFPLAEILPKERECLDKYLIKHFSDSISFKDTLINLSVTKNTFYIGPSAIVRDMMGQQANNRHDSSSSDLHSRNNQYMEVQKRAFSVMTNFYTHLSDAAFYKGMVYYPIYVEKVEATNIKPNYDTGKSLDQRFDYSFILLTNDLIDNGSTGRMKVNEEGVINFLYIYLHLFHSPFLLNQEMGYSVGPKTGLTSINKQDIIIIMKFYKLIQKFDLNPVKVFLSIYQLIKEAKTITQDFQDEGSQPNNFGKKMSNRLMDNTDKFKGEHFKNLLEDVVKKIVTIYTELHNTKDASEAKRLSNANLMLEVVKLVLEEREIYDFVENLGEGRTSRDTRVQAVADYHHYQDIIGLFEGLSNYNSLGITDIIKDMDINFDKDITIEHTNMDESAQITRLVGVIDRNNFNTAYNKFIIDFKAYLDTSLKNELQPVVDKANKDRRDREQDDSGVKQGKQQISKLENDIMLNSESMFNNKVQMKILIDKGYDNLSNDEIDRVTSLESLVNIEAQRETELNRLLVDAQNTLTVKNAAVTQKDYVVNYGEITNSIYNNIDDSLGFIYKDLENIYMNPMALNEILNNKSTFNYEELPKDALSLNSTLNATERTSSDFVHNLFQQLGEDVSYLAETIDNEIEHLVSRKTDVLNDSNSFGIQKIKDNIIKSLGLRFFGIMHKYLRNVNTSVNKTLSYSSKMQGIHPLLGKMARDPSNFKSFILSTNVLSTLYDLIFITQEKMFLSNLINKPPRKLNNVDNQVQFIVKNTLGLQNNPVWIVGGNKIRLLLPDFLSLTGVPIASEIPKNKLQGICKLDYKQWWKSDHMGTLNRGISESKNPNIEKIENEIAQKNKMAKVIKDKGDKASQSETNQLRALKDEVTRLEDSKVKVAIAAGTGNLGNIGRSFNQDGKDNYDEFKADFNVNTSDKEAYDALSDIEKATQVDPSSNEQDAGLEMNRNTNLDNLRDQELGVLNKYENQAGTTSMGNLGDDIRSRLMSDRLRGRV